MGLRAVQRLAVPRQAGVVVMLRFQWDSLRRGDLVLVHDAAGPTCADAGRHRSRRHPTGRPDVPVRYTDGADAGEVVRPGRFATHFDPLDDEGDCWRCHDLLEAG